MSKRQLKILSWVAGSTIAMVAYALTQDVFFPRGWAWAAFMTTWALAALWHVVADGFEGLIKEANAVSAPKAPSEKEST